MKRYSSDQLHTQWFGGYHKEQVDDVLESAVSEIKYLYQKVDELTLKIRQLADQELQLILASDLVYQDLVFCDVEDVILLRDEISHETLVLAMADDSQPEIYNLLCSVISKRMYEEIHERLAEEEFPTEEIEQAQKEILNVMKRLCEEKLIYIFKS